MQETDQPPAKPVDTRPELIRHVDQLHENAGEVFNLVNTLLERLRPILRPLPNVGQYGMFDAPRTTDQLRDDFRKLAEIANAKGSEPMAKITTDIDSCESLLSDTILNLKSAMQALSV